MGGDVTRAFFQIGLLLITLKADANSSWNSFVAFAILRKKNVELILIKIIDPFKRMLRPRREGFSSETTSGTGFLSRTLSSLKQTTVFPFNCLYRGFQLVCHLTGLLVPISCRLFHVSKIYSVSTIPRDTQ